MLRYITKTRPGLVALYDIRPGNGAGPFLQPRSPHRAPDAGLPHPPPSPHSRPPPTAIVLYTDPLENEQQVASCVFFHSRKIENALRE